MIVNEANGGNPLPVTAEGMISYIRDQLDYPGLQTAIGEAQAEYDAARQALEDAQQRLSAHESSGEPEPPGELEEWLAKRKRLADTIPTFQARANAKAQAVTSARARLTTSLLGIIAGIRVDLRERRREVERLRTARVEQLQAELRITESQHWAPWQEISKANSALEKAAVALR